jgi:hypothetical protein
MEQRHEFHEEVGILYCRQTEKYKQAEKIRGLRAPSNEGYLELMAIYTFHSSIAASEIRQL